MRKTGCLLALAVGGGLMVASGAVGGTLSGFSQSPTSMIGSAVERVQYYDHGYHRHCYRRCVRYDYYHHCVYYERYCEGGGGGGGGY